MEVKIGVLHTPREIVVDSTQTPDRGRGAGCRGAEERRRAARTHRRARSPGDRAGQPGRLRRDRPGRRAAGRLRQHHPGCLASAGVVAAESLRQRSPSVAIRSACRSVIRPISPATPDRSPVPSTSSIISASRSASTCWAWLIASPTSRRPHSASRPACPGCAATAARTSRTANSAWPTSASTSSISARVGSST